MPSYSCTSEVQRIHALQGRCLAATNGVDVCEFEEDGARLAHPAVCSKFIECENGATVAIRSCPYGLHFNRYESICDYKFRAGCDVSYALQLMNYEGDTEFDCEICKVKCSRQKISGELDPLRPTSTGPKVKPQPSSPSEPLACENKPTPPPPKPNSTPCVTTSSTPPPPSTSCASRPTSLPKPITTPQQHSTSPPPPPPSKSSEKPCGGPTPTPPPSEPTPPPPDPTTPPPSKPAEKPCGPPTPPPPDPIPTSPPKPGEKPCGPPTAPTPPPPKPTPPPPPPLSKPAEKPCGLPTASTPAPPKPITTTPGAEKTTLKPTSPPCASKSSKPFKSNNGKTLSGRLALQTFSGQSTSKKLCENPGQCIGQKDGTMFSDPLTTGFIVCRSECEIKMACPKSLVYNPRLRVCDWPRE